MGEGGGGAGVANSKTGQLGALDEEEDENEMPAKDLN